MLNIDLEYKKGILFLRLNGVLNEKNCFILEDAIKNVVSKGGIKYLLINFEKLYDIDEKGISSIIDSYKEYLKDRGKLLICGYHDKTKLFIERSELKDFALITINEVVAFNLINI